MNAHGKSQFQAMLQLFEGYLDKKDVGDEARYDKVREGAIVFLGTLARHLDPSDAKVRYLRCSLQNVPLEGQTVSTSDGSRSDSPASEALWQ